MPRKRRSYPAELKAKVALEAAGPLRDSRRVDGGCSGAGCSARSCSAMA